MSLAAGSRLGPYEIGSPLGAGGMGEVYKAKDTRLDRSVAIKVLPAHLSSDTDLRARFEREARVVSSLNHPHICTLHDIGHQDGVDFLVMEYLDGETLADRLVRGALPLEQALRFGIQIADALDRAHRAGVVHRDLKPGNVILTKSGAKLLDFGLSKALASASATGLSTLATEAKPLTEKGTVLGTVQYMAPEQLEGKDADARSDLFAFGSVLYEMLTGQRAFKGASQASLIGAILRDEPAPIATLQPLTPPVVDRVVATCLAKDPDERWQSAHDLGRELRWIAEGSSVGRAGEGALPSRAPAPARRLPWIVAAGATLVAALLAALLLLRPASVPRAIRASILPPPDVHISSNSVAPAPLALSPDGTRLAFCAHAGMGADRLWIQSVASGEARPLDGTEGATQPFWSPDGRSLGFFADRKLKRVDAAGGPVLTLATARDPRGGSWNAAGTIIFCPYSSAPVYRLPASGGAPTLVTKLEGGETTHRYPEFLPDGKHFLYLARRSRAGPGQEAIVYAGSIDGASRRPVASVASNAVYASGHLLFVRQGILVAQPFDPAALVTKGEPVPVAADARMDERYSRGVFSASRDGVLAYEPGKLVRKDVLRRYDRSGRVVDTFGEPANFYADGAPSLSPDGSRAIVAIQSEAGNSDLWLVNTTSGVRSRFTLDAEDHSGGAWSPDGLRVVLSSSNADGTRLLLKGADGSGSVQDLVSAKDRTTTWSPLTISPDGRTLIVSADAAVGSTDLVMLPLDGERKLVPFAATEASESLAAFSPNGRFVAYTSDATGRDEVYVAAFPQPGDTWQVSQNGGREPRWSTTGKELFFFDRDNRLQAASIDAAGSRFEVASIKALFQVPSRGSQWNWRYDVFPGGEQFLIGTPTDDDLVSPISLVTEWTRSSR